MLALIMAAAIDFRPPDSSRINLVGANVYQIPWRGSWGTPPVVLTPCPPAYQNDHKIKGQRWTLTIA